MAKQMKIPPKPKLSTITYQDLKGADFSQDQSLVKRDRSPDLLNMVSDQGGLPVKRRGWEVLNSTYSDPIHNIWTFVIHGRRRCVVAIGDKLMEYNLATNQYGSTSITVSAGKKAAFFMQTVQHKGLYVLAGDKFIECTANTNEAPLTFSEVKPKAPLILIARDPVSGGGVVYEPINKLTRERQEMFLNKDSSKTFLVSATVDTTKPRKFEYKDSNGNWQTASETVAGATFTVTETYTPPVVGEDNIRITYFATGENSAADVSGCTAVTHYSQSALDQVFITGNPDQPQYAYYSELGDPTYFPDLNYLLIGSGGTKIMGFMNIGLYLAVVKENSGEDTTVFLVSPTTVQDSAITTTTSNGSTTKYENRIEYKVQPATTGIGAVSRHCFRSLNDEPLMLSQTGIHGMVSTNITSEKIMRNRSKFINKKLLAEPNLENAVSEIWDNYYIVALNGNAYVLDGRRKVRDGLGGYFFECYFWDNVPANCFATFDNELYFGTQDGKICKFKRGTDMTVYSDDGAPIKAVWSTPLDSDGAAHYFKTMQKKGSMCTFAPFAQSSVDVYVQTDGKEKIYVGSAAINEGIDFAHVDFSKFTFDATTTPRDKFFNKKFKKYKRMKIILENNAVNEGFGVHSITKTVALTRYAK
jgi:hypothetical protein